MRLIDGDKLQEFPIRANHCDKEHANTHFINGIESVMEYAEQLPTVDAEVVVRCKDCKHSWEDLGGLTCSHGVCVDCVVLGDFYCANGERKKGADNG
jgi:hypothetical protein